MQAKRTIGKVTEILLYTDMTTFGSALATVMKASKSDPQLSNLEVAALTGYTRQFVSNVRGGQRTVGAKTVATFIAKLRDRKNAQEMLLTAFLQQVVKEVETELLEVPGAVTLKEDAKEASVAAATKVLKGHRVPQWLEELVEEAVAAGEANEEVLLYIAAMMEGVLHSKRIRSRTKKAK